jgi:hypothetical protein
VTVFARHALLLACAVALCALRAAPAAAAEPDPCSKGGRDACGTLGVGFYSATNGRARWFGDYRGAVRAEAHAFCIDLGFWYASPAYRYRRVTGMLRRRDGLPVPPEKQNRIAYALWAYGRTTDPTQQAAVMLYVHRMMGDTGVNRLPPTAAGSNVAALYWRIAATARRYHGPYRLALSAGGSPQVAQRAAATVRVVSATGHALPHVRLTFAGTTGARVRAGAVTGNDGTAQLAFTPTGGDVGLRASITLAANRPEVFVPTTRAAARYAQRLAVPSSQRLSMAVPVRAAPLLTAISTTDVVGRGSSISTRMSVRGTGLTTSVVETQFFGPFRSRSTISCSGRPRATRRTTFAGDARMTSSLSVSRVGFYTFRARLFGGARTPSVSTGCGDLTRTVLVAPRISAGRGGIGSAAAVATGSWQAPTRVRIAALGIDAPIGPAVIDMKHGLLAIPANIHRLGWWRDGMAPGAARGAVLVAGHVDSARAGKGAFFNLREARPGERVVVAATTTHTYRYRVTTVRVYPRSALPPSVYSLRGPARLVLVTCGGPFDAATGHYRDNVVVTAVPLTG